MALIGRFFVIWFAVIVASIAAGMAFAFAVLGPAWSGLTGSPGEQVGFWMVSIVGLSFAGAALFLPLVISIVLAESFNVRSIFAYAAAGAVLALLAYYGGGLARPSYEESIDRAPPLMSREAEISAAAGAVFGLVYWLIAGRNAGRWKGRG